MVKAPIVGGGLMARSLSAHIEIVEKDPIERAISVGLGSLLDSGPLPIFENWTLGVKWSWRGTWYGFWGEYAPGKRLQAYLLLVYKFVKFAIFQRAPRLLEGATSGAVFLVD